MLPRPHLHHKPSSAPSCISPPPSHHEPPRQSPRPPHRSLTLTAPITNPPLLPSAPHLHPIFACLPLYPRSAPATPPRPHLFLQQAPLPLPSNPFPSPSLAAAPASPLSRHPRQCLPRPLRQAPSPPIASPSCPPPLACRRPRRRGPPALRGRAHCASAPCSLRQEPGARPPLQTLARRLLLRGVGPSVPGRQRLAPGRSAFVPPPATQPLGSGTPGEPEGRAPPAERRGVAAETPQFRFPCVTEALQRRQRAALVMLSCGRNGGGA